MSYRESLTSELQWKNFGFSGASGAKFYVWQWRVPPILIVIYKILMSAYLISTLLYNFLTFQSDIPWPAYFTSWTYTLLTTYHVVHAVVVLHHVRTSTCHTCFSLSLREEHHRPFQKQLETPADETRPVVPSQQQSDDVPLHLIILWIMYGVCNAMCPIVTCMWYATVATPDDAFLPRELFVHAINSVVVLIDQMVSATPVRLLHFPFPVVFGLVYYLFSIFYWMADTKHVLYEKVLDWNHPALPFGMIFFTSCVAVIFHCISYGIYRGRLAIYYRLVRGN
ncbi:protein rolling stone-like [Haliotis asinina]|uniref:protein rolling stone-like n=1 Tax=Haliotis asinina TaxID=109174 RepID=UPI003532590D